MRATALLACALLLLVGCGKSSDPPKVALNSTDASGSDGGKDNRGKNDRPGKKQGKQEVPGEKGKTSPADNLAFDPQDPHNTLTWLVKRSEKVRAAPSDGPARQEYEREVKSAEGQTIHWTLKVDSLHHEPPAGVVLETLKSPADPKCSLRLAPKQDPDAAFGTTFVLTTPEGTKFGRGDRVTVTGVVEKIHDPGKCEFQVRLSKYTVTAAK
jgi:hypothetical protein